MGWSQHYHEDSDCIYCSRFVVVPVKKNQRTKNLLLYLLKKILNLYLQKLQKPNLALLMNASQQFRKNSKLICKSLDDMLIYKVDLLSRFFC